MKAMGLKISHMGRMCSQNEERYTENMRIISLTMEMHIGASVQLKN